MKNTLDQGTSKMELDLHRENLNKFCRLCGKEKAIPLDRKPYVKEDFAIAIRDGFGPKSAIDISKDLPDVHPPFVCDPCRRRLMEWHKKKKRKTITGIEVHTFLPHSETCKYCGFDDLSKPSAVQTVAKVAADKHSFLTMNIEDKYIFLTLDKQTLNVDRAIHIYRDSTWSLEIYGKTVPSNHEKLKSFPQKLTANDVPALFAVAQLQACIGSPFTLFRKHDVPWHSSTYFEDNQGNKTGEVDCKYVFVHGGESVSMTVRYGNCCGLADSDRESCHRCLTFRGDLHSRLNKKKDKKDAGSSSSHARHDRMTHEEKDKKIHNLKHDKTILKKHITVLEKKIEKIMQEESMELGDEDNSSLLEIVQKNETLMDLTLQKDTPMKLLWDEQMKYISHKDPRQHRWHPTIIKWCIAMYEKSPSAYKMLRKSDFVKLPHQTTLHQYTHFTDAISGINPDILEHLVKEAKLNSRPQREENVSILFDEMKIKAGLVFSQRSGKISGFTEMGHINDEFASFERRVNGNEDPPLASHVLVLMVRGIFSGLKHPLAYYPSTGASGNQLFHILWEAIDVLEFAGFKVRALVADGAAPNRKFFSLNASNPRGTSITYHTPNPNCPSRNIYFVCDVPHLLKTTRNCFENSGWNSKTRNMKVRAE